MGTASWPGLPYEEWKDTYATLHMWTQIAGKIALGSAARLNHCWASALHVTPRGLSTTTLPDGHRSFALEFDFIDHHLWIRTSNGDSSAIGLTPRSVANFYAEVMTTLGRMSLPSRIWSMPVEIPSPVRFEQDTAHSSYDRDRAERFWRILLQVHQAFTTSRRGFLGKSSPSHFFWGSFDLAVTRFSGRPAPPREGPAFMRDAYSHEVISHGFWPGSGAVLEPAFYAYAAPEPAGLKDVRVRPDGAYYHAEMGEFILPYEVVRNAASPERALADFIDSTYEAAATLAGWDRAALER